MLHKSRVWSIFPAESPQWLALQLTQCTWCGCNGFSLGDYLFVNDATSADGAQEYAALLRRANHYVQIESLTFSWMTPERALEVIQQVVAGEFDGESYDTVEVDRIQIPEQHGRCHLCA